MAFHGIEIPPYFRVLPPDMPPNAFGPPGNMTLLRLKSGIGFGVGTHETTQLCLLAMGHFLRSGSQPCSVLDFGAGSGILAIGAALSGARVEAIENHLPSLENARENVSLNGVDTRVDLRTELSEPPRTFDLVIANILNRVLLEFAEPLCQRLSRHGRMILSGLVATDVPSILGRYRPLLESMVAQVHERGDWRAIVFAPGSQTEV